MEIRRTIWWGRCAWLPIWESDDLTTRTRKIEHLSALLKVYQDEIKRLWRAISRLSKRAIPIRTMHPYSFDLDVFGKSSLFNRICRTITSGGSEAPRQESYPGNAFGHGGYQKKKRFGRRNWLEKAKTGEWNFWHLAKRTEAKLMAKWWMARWRRLILLRWWMRMQKVSKMEVPAWFGSPVSLSLSDGCWLSESSVPWFYRYAIWFRWISPCGGCWFNTWWCSSSASRHLIR